MADRALRLSSLMCMIQASLLPCLSSSSSVWKPLRVRSACSHTPPSARLACH